MEIVIHTNWGSYKIPKPLIDLIPTINELGEYDDSIEVRTHPAFIDYVKKYSYLKDYAVKNIPDEATDFRINDYDGWESIIAVIDGKLVDIK